MTNFGDETQATANEGYTDGWMFVREFVSFPGGDVSSISFSCKYSAAGAVWRGVVYDATGAGGEPGDLLWISEEFAMTSGMDAFAFRTANKYGGGSTTIGAQDLYIGLWAGTAATIFGDSTEGGTGFEISGIAYSATSEPGNDPWNRAGDASYNWLERVYITYTAGSAPTVTTTAISDITATTATGGGTITSDGGAEVTAYGVCWNTTGTPTTADSHTHDEP